MPNGPDNNGWAAEQKLYRQQVRSGFQELHVRMEKSDKRADTRYKELKQAYSELKLAYVASQAAYKAEIRFRAILWGTGSAVIISVISALIVVYLTAPA